MPTNTTSVAPWEGVQPYALGFLNQAQQVADQPYQAYQGPTVAGFNQYQTSALNATADRASNGSPVMNAANNTLTNTINGGFLNGNPYLDQQIGQAQGDAVKSWNTMAKPAWDTSQQRSGSFGNAGLAEMQNQAASNTQQNIGRIGSDMRFNNYNAERGRQMSSLGLAPSFAQNDYTDLNAAMGAGNAIQGQDQRFMDDSYKRFIEQRNYPQQQVDAMGKAIGAMNFGSTTQSPGTSTGAGLLGGALTGAQIWNMLFNQTPPTPGG